MITPQSIILACWIIFLVVWAISSIGVKRNVKGYSYWQGMGFPLAIVLILLIFVRNIPSFGQFFHLLEIGHFWNFVGSGTYASSNFIFESIGAALTALGIAFAIWARVHLGRNWGMPMSIKENPDLVTSGPYAYIRHPIYTGMLTALLGSAIASSLILLIVFVVFLMYVLYSVKQEEELMTKTFPKEYPAYKKRTKTLIPSVW